MHDPLDIENRPLFDRLDRTRAVTKLVLLWEELVRCGWRVFFWLVLFLGIWLLKLPGLFDNTGYIGANIIFLGGLLALAFLDFRTVTWPSQAAVNRRIEQASALKHRPLTALDDKPFSIKSKDTRDLWASHFPTLLAALKKIRKPWPQPLLAAKDPKAFRFAALLLAVIGFWVAGPTWPERLHHGLIPYGWVEQAADVPDILITLTPPEYTQISQTIVQSENRGQHSMDIPQGSILQIKMLSRLGAPVLKSETQDWPFEDIGNQNYALEIEVPKGESLWISTWLGTAFTLDYTLVPDTPPEIALQEDSEITALPDAQTQIPLRIKDDYGVETLHMSMTLDPVVTEAPLGYPQSESRSVMSPAGEDFMISPVYDFTANPWAGLPVILEIEVSDMTGQTTALEPVSFILPEREFQHPIAKKLVALRKRLGWSPETDMIPVADEILEILPYPQDYQDDIVVFLALRAAASRLIYAYQNIAPEADDAEKDHADTRAVMALLWDTALRIEDGNLSLAARDLRQAQMALENALQNENTSPEDIAQLMNTLKQAMAEYLSALAEELQKRMAEGEDVPMLSPEALADMIDPEALNSFMEQMENEMLSGNTRQAQDMLSQLQRMLDLLNPNMAEPMPMDMMAMMEGVSELQQLIDKQKSLLEQTEKQAAEMETQRMIERNFGDLLAPDIELLREWGLQNMPPPPTDAPQYTLPNVDTQANMTEQEALRYILGQLMLDADSAIGEIPEKMGMAEQEMRLSGESLGLNNPGGSIPHQQMAIEYLEDAQQDLSEQLQERMQQMMGGQQQMMLGQGSPQQYDPLGRPLQGDGGEDGNQPFSPNSRVKIPDEAERKRVQEILRILREKSGDFSRSREELDYFRRLLKQF